MDRDYSEQVESKNNKKMRKEACRKTIVSILLSFIAFIIIVFWKALRNEFNDIIILLNEFFYVKLSLLTISISNSASIITSIYDIDNFWTKTSKHIRKKYRESNSHSYSIWPSICVLFVCLIIYLNSFTTVTPTQFIFSIFFYFVNIYFLYQINLQREQEKPEKYEIFDLELKKEQGEILNGKMLNETDEGIEL